MTATADAVPGRAWAGLVLFVLIIGPLSAIAVRDVWRGPREGEAPRSGLARALPSLAVSLASGILLVPLMAVTDEIGPATALLAILFTAGAVLGLLFGVTAYLFGRPRCVVPPPMRSARRRQSGADR